LLFSTRRSIDPPAPLSNVDSTEPINDLASKSSRELQFKEGRLAAVETNAMQKVWDET
jgi:hypothetical protein